ncbi:MAG: glycosyltransferase family 2 protein [Lachnospiraceae bacterium]|nr:glycosyltransferase family 2 protein [Lachnospiraceae bacterium]
MKNEPKISVIVPVYNKEQYLEKCLDSLLAQTYPNKEIVIADDGSTDESGKICDRYAALHDEIKVIHKENGGLISAWKAGFFASTGEYVTFVDSDDYVDTVMLKEMAEKLSGIKGEVVLSDYAITMDDGSERFVYQTLKPGEYDRKTIKNKIIPELLGREHRIISYSRCMKLIERSLIESNTHNLDERVGMAEDSTIILPVLFDSSRIYMMDRKVYYHYRYIKDSMVHRYDRNLYENNRIYQSVIKRIIEEKFTGDEREKMLKDLDREEVLLFLHLVKNEVRGNPSGCRENLKKLIEDPFVANIVKNTEVKLDDKANRLVYAVLKDPSKIKILMLKIAFWIYYKTR